MGPPGLDTWSRLEWDGGGGTDMLAPVICLWEVWHECPSPCDHHWESKYVSAYLYIKTNHTHIPYT